MIFLAFWSLMVIVLWELVLWVLKHAVEKFLDWMGT